MRDLDQLQEQDPEEPGRGVGTWIVLSALLLLLLGAGFVLWQRGEKAGTSPEDPLDQLAQLARPDTQRTPDAGKSERHKALDSHKLTYERSLSEDEDRPEVVAALAAAALEEERLARAQAALSKDRTVAPEPLSALAEDEGETEAAMPPSSPIPAGLAASASGSKLEKSAKHDKLVAAAMPRSTRGSARTGGSGEGEFMLQVISYAARTQAEAFATALRERGHEAFVEMGEVSGRGRSYRVRIGPFKSKPAADAYRRDFDEREHMNTIVVRRDD